MFFSILFFSKDSEFSNFVLCSKEGDFDLNFVAKTGMNWDQTEEEIMKDLEISAPVVVFVDQLNHHSNILPWREAGFEFFVCFQKKPKILIFSCLQAQKS